MTRLAVRCDKTGTIHSVLHADSPEMTDVVGRALSAVLDPSSVVRGLDLLEEARNVGAVIDAELLVRVQGQPVLLRAAAARDGDEVLVVAASATRDLWSLCAQLSEDVAATKSRSAFVALLERRANVAIARDERALDELTRLYDQLATLDRDLARRNAELEYLSREKDRILGMAAHDLRSPLNAIALSISFLDLELARDLNDTGREVLTRIRRSAEQMGRLIDDLLDVATVEHGGPRLKPSLVAIEPLLREATQMHSLLAARHGVTIAFDAPNDLPAVQLDADRLHQVLGNLISNGVGHTPEGGTVTIRASIADDHLNVSVIDQGPGIDANDLPHLFQPFRRGRGRRLSGGSIGLGLTISRTLIEAHGGVLEANNLPEGGAEFHFTLPLRPSRATAKIAAAE